MKRYAIVIHNKTVSKALWQGEDYFAARRAESEYPYGAELLQYEVEYDYAAAVVRIVFDGDERAKWYSVTYKEDDILQAFECVKNEEYKGDINMLAWRVALSEAESMMPDADNPSYPYTFAEMFKDMPFVADLGIDVDIAHAIYPQILDMAERLRDYHKEEGDI